MALGKKSKTAPEIGDLVRMGSGSSNFVFDDVNASNIIEEVPSGVSLGAILSIQTNEDDIEMYEIDKGFVYADEVTTSINSNYNYPDKPISANNTTQDTKTNSGGVWTAINTFLSGIFGVINKKKTTTTVDGDTDEDGVTIETPNDTTTKTGTPTWVWFTAGGVILTGIIVALAWPKKKPQTTPQQPIVLK